MKKVLKMLLIIGLLSGCSNYRELNEIGLIIAIGIDLPQERETGYRVTYQVINPSQFSQNGAGNGIPVINYTVEAESFLESYRKASVIIPRENRVTHLSLIVIGEAVAREGLDLLFALAERGESRSTFPVFIARDTTAENILGVIEPVESNPTKSIISTSENNQKMYAISNVMPVYKAISLLADEGTNLLLSGVKLRKELKSPNQSENLQNIKPAVVEVSGLAMFKKDKLIGWYDGQFARTAHLIKSEVESTSFPIACSDNKRITFLTTGIKSSIKTVLKPKLTLEVNVSLKSNIGEVNCNIDISNQKEIEKLEKSLEEEIENQIKQTIQIAQGEGTDVFGFGNKLSKDDSAYWKKHKNEWQTIFSHADMDVKVDAVISNSGMLTDPYEIK
ncbi:Ger(x)C family spore germination protein [Bacillus sp. ISL-47]|uniref:Ger(x)C family spore germination protein n=1 Tax=Bacillus sp. ISL-47 TaxID=2819130 RepID=UPI001BE651C7|nr:Ger(x)C family spore germination protein [Bacillus sp. ISL-47]MBT2687736.1 Ger(x)C family spore germination protein [Bacillus sp. ISL-47]